MSIDRGMDKDDVAHVYNGILLSQKKEWNCATCRDVDGPRWLDISKNLSWTPISKFYEQFNLFNFHPHL